MSITKHCPVAVVIPAFNKPDELARALESISHQTLLPEAVIVADDGSSADLRSVIDRFRKQLEIDYLKLEPSGGPSKPRNEGVRAAPCEWVALLDSDDEWHPQKLEACARHFACADIVDHALVTRPRPTWKFWARQVGGEQRIPFTSFDLLTLGNKFATSSVLIRREIYMTVGGMASSKQVIEDYDFWIRCAKAGIRSTTLSRSLGTYHISPASFSTATEHQISLLKNTFARHSESFDGIKRKYIDAYLELLLAEQYRRMGNESMHLAALKLATPLRSRVQRYKRLCKLNSLGMQNHARST